MASVASPGLGEGVDHTVAIVAVAYFARSCLINAIFPQPWNEDFAVSEEEMKAWQEKQLKRDQLSNMMGEYLLKGYRMLDSYCSDCGSILMSSPGSGSTDILCLQCLHRGKRKQPRPQTEMTARNVVETTPTEHAPSAQDCLAEEGVLLESIRKVLLGRLSWAKGQLECCSSVEYCQQLCQLIQTITVTLKHIKSLL